MLRVGDIAIAGQPSPEQLAEVEAAGYRTVINIRSPEEIDWNEGARVGDTGMRYVQVPITPQTIEVGVLARLRTLIDDSPKPILFHCASGNRVSLVWGMLEAGNRSEEEILEIAREGGLKSKYEPMLREYLEQHAAGGGRLR